ncbi:alpha/beta fold hydrolase [Companilactobacillus halodurans]|uniref:Alpha/beta hydrolase n=1 Tax=Companilactobacillus halodurans TaxID=2584183 RepID=A0A5P0ZRM0_9LACO|nr:alpha/beta hydrolase [Companilactobacillus halodurans]MQS76910.1 alpha/beta hydrolase [Companilactobacillus halodurans]MQS98382.1 alpha/beta hydrolase [Companilactobacillus halodurans]
MEKILSTSEGSVNTNLVKSQKGKGVIVLIPGINGSIEYFNEIIPYLKDKYTVVALDLLGQGKSTGAKNDHYTIDAQAWNMLEAIARMKITDQLVIFGYGVGGLVALNMAELRGFTISKLILLNTPANDKYADMDAHSSVASIPLLGKLAKSPVKAGMFFDKNFDKTTLKNPKVVDEAANAVEHKAAKKLQKMSTAYLEEKALNKRLRAVKIPTLALFGDGDQVLTENGIKDAKASIGRVPDLQIEDIKGAGHLAMLEKPEEVAQKIIKFDETTVKKEDNKD